MSRRAWRWLIPLSALPVLALLAYGFRVNPREIPSPLVGRPAPGFALTTFDGAPLTLEAQRGKVVVVNFWASWCDPCKHEAHLLESTWQRVQSQSVVFIGVDYEDTRSEGLNFLHTYGITYANVVDSNGATAINYGVTGVPESFFIDCRGVVVHKVTGELSEQTLESNLAMLSRSASC